jgi:NADPH2:quinone reductase
MHDMPSEMNFIATQRPGGPEVMELVRGPVPRPKAGELLIRVAWAGVNRPDVLQRKGGYPPPADASPIIGLEVAGTVAALGEGTQGWRVGDAVCALTNGGGYAEFCTAPATQCLAPPAGYDLKRAAALPETCFTVWANLFERGQLASGETCLIHGGSSGIGTTAIQLAKAFGATVYATAGSPEKVAACMALGADAAIDYRAQDFVTEVRHLTGGQGVNVILDMVGGPYMARNIACLAVEGRLVMIAFLQGSKVPEFDFGPVMVRRLSITGSTMRPRTAAQKGAIAAALKAKVWPLLAAGKCPPVIHATFPLDDADEAHALMESSAHIGKILLQAAP